MLAASDGEPPKTFGRPVSRVNKNRAMMGQIILTGVQMTVEVNDGNRSISSIEGTQQRESNGMITAKSDDSR